MKDYDAEQAAKETLFRVEPSGGERIKANGEGEIRMEKSLTGKRRKNSLN